MKGYEHNWKDLIAFISRKDVRDFIIVKRLACKKQKKKKKKNKVDA